MAVEGFANRPLASTGIFVRVPTAQLGWCLPFASSQFIARSFRSRIKNQFHLVLRLDCRQEALECLWTATLLLPVSQPDNGSNSQSDPYRKESFG